MTDDPILVLDAGSSSLRGCLVAPSGSIAAVASRPWSYQIEPDLPELARSFDADACWRAALDVMAECVGGLPDGARVSAVAVTSQRQSLVLLDENGESLYAAPNTDLRAVFEGAALDAEHGQTLYRTTGHRPAFMMAAGKLAWFRDHRPDAYARVRHVLTLADWLAYKLSGQVATETTLAAGAGLLELDTRRPASAMFTELGLDLPEAPVCDALTARGTVSTIDAGALSGAPVVVAGADTQCGLIGLGVVDAGSAGIVAGWSATVQTLVPNPVTSPDMATWTGCFQSPGLWTVESGAGDVGNAYDWLANTLFSGGDAAYSRMDALAASEPTGADGVTAFLGPGLMNVASVGMNLGGILFPAPLTLGGPSLGQIIRATLESFAYALRANLEQAERVSGRAASSVGIAGGLTRSATFVRIMPDALGREVHVSREPNATAVGAARVARVATGEIASLRQAAQIARDNLRAIPPTPLTAAEYEERYHTWLETQRALSTLPL